MELSEKSFEKIRELLHDGDPFQMNTSRRFLFIKHGYKTGEYSMQELPAKLAQFIREKIIVTDYCDTPQGIKSKAQVADHLEGLTRVFRKITDGASYEALSPGERQALMHSAEYFGEAQALIETERRKFTKECHTDIIKFQETERNAAIMRRLLEIAIPTNQSQWDSYRDIS